MQAPLIRQKGNCFFFILSSFIFWCAPRKSAAWWCENCQKMQRKL